MCVCVCQFGLVNVQLDNTVLMLGSLFANLSIQQLLMLAITILATADEAILILPIHLMRKFILPALEMSRLLTSDMKKKVTLIPIVTNDYINVQIHVHKKSSPVNINGRIQVLISHTINICSYTLIKSFVFIDG